MVARVLNLMGCYFGPEGVHSGMSAENPKGFWERVDIRSANDALLQGAGLDWDRVSDFSLERLPSPLVTAYKVRYKRIFLELDAHRPWFIKEPRLCLLLPLIRDLLERPAVVLVARDPIEVAMSLEARNGIPRSAGIALWECYMVQALRASAGLPRLLVRHSDLVSQPLEAVHKLWSELVELGCDTLRKPSTEEISSFIDLRYYRQRRPDESRNASLPESVVRLLGYLEQTTSRQDQIDDVLVGDCSIDQLRLYERMRSLEHDLKIRQSENKDLRRGIEQTEIVVDDLEHTIAQIKETLRAEQLQLVEARESLRTHLRDFFEELEALDLSSIHRLELEKLAIPLVHTRNLLLATRASWRWRAGDLIVSTIQRLRGRRRPEKLALDSAIETLQGIERESLKRR